MKKLIVLFTLLAFSTQAQIEVYEKKDQTIYCTHSSLHCIFKSTIDTTSTYWLTFDDFAYKYIEVSKSLSFTTKDDLIAFFMYIAGCIDNQDSQILVFNDQTVTINFENSNAKVSYQEGYFFMSKKQALRCIEEIKNFNN